MKKSESKFAPKKSLGQHFLVAPGIVEKICDWICVDTNLPVVEVGPGRGALTEEILKRGCQVLALEVDRDLIAELKSKFKSEIIEKQFEILEFDASRVAPIEIEKAFIKFGKPADTHFIICGNLPYNVGTQIVMNFLECFKNAKRFVFMLQKEVVLRFLSEGNNSDYGPLAVKMAWLSRVIGKFWVKPGSFDPPPRVDSGVFCFERNTQLPAGIDPFGKQEGLYSQASDFVAKIFQNRRKMLRAIDKQFAGTTWGSKRPQEMTPKELLEIVQSLEVKAHP